jgi:hypothetical protein
MEKYMILDLSRSSSGVIWWWKQSKYGYTTQLDEAGRFTAEEAWDILTEPFTNDLQAYQASDLEGYSVISYMLLLQIAKPVDSIPILPKPTPEQYGYEASTLYDEGGWMIEGGEEKYYQDLEKWTTRYEKTSAIKG